MKISDIAIQFGGTALVYLYPLILLAVFALPFVVTYFTKKKITLTSGLLSAVIGIVLVAITLFLSLQLFAYLQGEAFKAIYGIK